MRRIVIVSLVLAALAGCATVPPDQDPVQIKLNELDGRVGRIERVVSNQSLLDLAQKVDALQAENRQLRGRLEELENSSESLRKQQRDLYSDLDKRVGQLGTSPSIGGTTGLPPGASGPAFGGAGGSAGGDQAAYTAAFDALKSGNYANAINGFRNYLTAYPQGALADNAQYWLGEAYYVSKDYPNAAFAFKTVVDQYPNSRKVPDALLKLGFAQFEMKQFGSARTTLTDVTRRFPDSDAAKLANDRLKRIP
jgi:tol-pal system protein YbgF